MVRIVNTRIKKQNTDITGESLAKFIKDQPKKLKYINLDNIKNLNLKHLKETFSESNADVNLSISPSL